MKHSCEVKPWPRICKVPRSILLHSSLSTTNMSVVPWTGRLSWVAPITRLKYLLSPHCWAGYHNSSREVLGSNPQSNEIKLPRLGCECVCVYPYNMTLDLYLWVSLYVELKEDITCVSPASSLFPEIKLLPCLLKISVCTGDTCVKLCGWLRTPLNHCGSVCTYGYLSM